MRSLPRNLVPYLALVISALACQKGSPDLAGQVDSSGGGDQSSGATDSAAGSGQDPMGPQTSMGTAQPPSYVGSPPENAARLHELAPARYTTYPPTEGTTLEVLYDQGFQGGRAMSVHVSQDYVYWEQLGALMQAPKNGEGPVVEFGRWALAAQFPIRSDAQHVYWIDRDQLRRRPHTGGEPEAVALPWNHSGGDLLIDEGFVYLAMPGCPSIMRINKQSLEQSLIYATADRPAPTTLLLHDGTLFCASGPTVFRVSRWEEGMQLHATHEHRAFTLGVHDDHLYWFGDPPAVRDKYMWRAPLKASGDSPIVAERLGQALTTLYGFVPDPRGVWVLRTQPGATLSLLAYSPAEDEGRVLAAKVGTGGGVDTDGKHHYFSQWAECCVDSELFPRCVGTCCETCSAIVRIPVTAPLHPIPAGGL